MGKGRPDRLDRPTFTALGLPWQAASARSLLQEVEPLSGSSHILVAPAGQVYDHHFVGGITRGAGSGGQPLAHFYGTGKRMCRLDGRNNALSAA
jgi:hypothetical protein